jgi:myosin heavy subunit
MAAMIWIPNATESWAPASVIADKGDKIQVRVRGTSSDTTIPGPINKYDIVSETSLEEVCENLVDLENYSEGIILHHIRTRFSKGLIYTFVANILVAINPYKSLDIYGIKVMEEAYQSIRRTEAKMKPHVFSVAAMTLANMREENKNQCVLISGESGAGKTGKTIFC